MEIEKHAASKGDSKPMHFEIMDGGKRGSLSLTAETMIEEMFMCLRLKKRQDLCIHEMPSSGSGSKRAQAVVLW